MVNRDRVQRHVLASSAAKVSSAAALKTSSTPLEAIKALTLCCASLPVLEIPIDIARSGSATLRRLVRVLRTLRALLGCRLIGA